MKKEYYICSEGVVISFPECEKSKPIKTGYKNDQPFFIAVLDFDRVEFKYNSMTEEDQDSFWCQEIVPGLMDVSMFTLKGIRANGIFYEIEAELGLCKQCNRAMTIHQLCDKFGMNPIEFGNKIGIKS